MSCTHTASRYYVQPYGINPYGYDSGMDVVMLDGAMIAGPFKAGEAEEWIEAETRKEPANGSTIVLVPPMSQRGLPQALKRDDWIADTERERDGSLQPAKHWLRDGLTASRFTWQDIDDCFISLGYTVHVVDMSCTQGGDQ